MPEATPDVSPLVILMAAIFTHNIALTYILGMCPFMAMSKRLNTAVGMGIAVTLVMLLTAPINYLIYHYLLVPFEVEVLSYIIFIATIASAVQLVEMVVGRFFPALESSFGVFLPLITVNCSILAVSIFLRLRNYSLPQTVLFSLGSGIGWWIAITIVAAIREKMRIRSKVPEGLKGAGITMVITGIIALAFLGFTGMMRIQ